jgi:hypothetical protein
MEGQAIFFFFPFPSFFFGKEAQSTSATDLAAGAERRHLRSSRSSHEIVPRNACIRTAILGFP